MRYSIAISIILALSAGLYTLINAVLATPDWQMLFQILSGIFSVSAIICLNSKRFHDIGLSGNNQWWLLAGYGAQQFMTAAAAETRSMALQYLGHSMLVFSILWVSWMLFMQAGEPARNAWGMPERRRKTKAATAMPVTEEAAQTEQPMDTAA